MQSSLARNADIESAIAHVGGRQADLARHIGCAQQTVSKLLHGELPVSAEHAVAIDKATRGAVPKQRLRPDLFGVGALPEATRAA
jgi:DNA-binding transcriptional regulator YdaS (Cro superfamily)